MGKRSYLKLIAQAVIAALIVFGASGALALAITCSNVFPTSLNGYITGSCIPSAWSNALEAAIGITNSTTTSSLEYRANNPFYKGSISTDSSNLSLTTTTTSTVIHATTSPIYVLVTAGTVSATTGTYSNITSNKFTNPTVTSAWLAADSSGNIIATSSPVRTATTTINQAQGNTFNFTTATTSGNPSITTSTNNGSSTVLFTFPTVSVTGANPLTTGNSPTVSAGTVVASSTSFSYTGATSSWTVPSNVGSIIINVQGAAANTACDGGVNEYGGSSTGTLGVTPGTTYYYAVGGKNGTVAGGFPNGGNGSTSCGGAGMSWFGSASTFSTSTAIIVAGGAGSGGNSTSNGGAGGGINGGTGGNNGGTGGVGGSQSAGGSLGGAAGVGGGGSSFGGGGGSGYYGGGAGVGGGAGNGAAGGGGSGYISPLLTSATTTAGINTATGTIKLTYNIQALLTGTNYAGIVTVPSTITTSTITFNSANFVNGTSCSVTPNNATNTAWISYTATSSFVITFQNALTVGQSFNYWCLGY